MSTKPKWTEDQNKALRKEIKKYQAINWGFISENMAMIHRTYRTPEACRKQWEKLQKEKTTKEIGVWMDVGGFMRELSRAETPAEKEITESQPKYTTPRYYDMLMYIVIIVVCIATVFTLAFRP